MKVSLPSQQNADMSSKVSLLPLVPVEEESLTKDNSVTIEISTNPGTAGAAKVKLSVRILSGRESIRSAITWKADVEKAVKGLNINAADQIGLRYDFCQSVLKDSALAAFNNKKNDLADLALEAAIDAAVANLGAGATQAQREAAIATERNRGRAHFYDAAHFDLALKSVIDMICPKGALANIKRALRRETRKPISMSLREYYQHLTRINYDELPLLPPFEADQGLSTDELIDIIIFGCPKSWSKEMEKQGFDPLTKSLIQVVDFLERIEATEDRPEPKSSGSKDSGKKKAKGSSKNDSSGGSKYCSLHGKGSHTTDECRTIQAKIKDLKSDESGGSKNKTWSRKADDEKKKSQKEFNSFVKKMVKKELNAMSSSKKRKAEANNIEVDDSGIDFDNFNLDDWKPDSSDDSSHESGSVNSEVST